MERFLRRAHPTTRVVFIALGLAPAQLALTACGEERILESESELVESLVVTFYLDPDTARAGEGVQVLLRISNPAADTVTLEAVNGCPGDLTIMDSTGATLVFVGASTCQVFDNQFGWVLPDSATSIDLFSDGPFDARWNLLASIKEPGSSEAPLPPLPGPYTVRLVTPSPLPTLEASLSVLPPLTAAVAVPRESQDG